MRWWKVLGLAAFAGVAATGIVITRAERRRRAYTPEEIRTRLRDRHAQAVAAATGPAAAPVPDRRTLLERLGAAPPGGPGRLWAPSPLATRVRRALRRR
ncbi:hypothetical protein Sru01_07910 [Sphaerisporangium rufum]|uniref:Uncharacterized protein n=1 Tax=Sphaerisporangium rufum TaxID=1381558 RepID=A0A919UXG3_9ACTN|nr:hypothetical protein [Sphaerisporangium rufum]GII75809.1 hypothetical protein Sru01_07910 [Sphaerisporangium rufum]